MDVINAATLVFNFAAGMGITHIVDEAVTTLVPKSPSRFVNICTQAGCFVLGTMLADKAYDYVKTTVQEVRENVATISESAAKMTEYIDQEISENDDAEEN